MNDTPTPRKTTQPYSAYPCPNPGPHGRPGCWCPSASSRCYGDIRAMREDFRTLTQSGAYTREEAAAICAEGTGNRWSADEILRRF